MIYLLLTIITCTLLVIILKFFERFQINTFQAIVVNYIICTSLGCLLSDMSAIHLSTITEQPWFYAALILGSCFIVLFNLMGWTAQNLGLTAVSVANKLSLIIPVSLAIFLYHENVNAIKVVGILLAFPAVYLATFKEEKSTIKQKRWIYFLPVILFIGSGFIDSLVNYAQKKLLTEALFGPFIIFIFGVAAAIGISILLYQLIFLKNKIALKNIAGGIVLGIPNYFSMYFLVKALAMKGWESSAVFTINNVGIVLLSALCGLVIFNEKFSIKNIIGIILACLAIIIIAFAR